MGIYNTILDEIFRIPYAEEQDVTERELYCLDSVISLLHFAGDEMPLDRLLCMLYLAECEYLEKYHSPFIYANIVKKNDIPVLTEIYEGCVSSKKPAWRYTIGYDGEYVWVRHGGLPKLTSTEASTEHMYNIWKKYKDYTLEELKQCIHQRPEWSSDDLSFKAIAEANNIEGKEVVENIEDIGDIDYPLTFTNKYSYR